VRDDGEVRRPGRVPVSRRHRGELLGDSDDTSGARGEHDRAREPASGAGGAAPRCGADENSHARSGNEGSDDTGDQGTEADVETDTETDTESKDAAKGGEQSDDNQDVQDAESTDQESEEEPRNRYSMDEETVETGSGRNGRTELIGQDLGAQDPADLINPDEWYLTLPTGKAGGPDTVEGDELRTFSNDFFKLTPERDGIVFAANAGGVTTENSQYPRSELREMNGSEKAAWSNASGTHTLDVCEAVLLGAPHGGVNPAGREGPPVPRHISGRQPLAKKGLALVAALLALGLCPAEELRELRAWIHVRPAARTRDVKGVVMS
jgi:hypothetical protein